MMSEHSKDYNAFNLHVIIRPLAFYQGAVDSLPLSSQTPNPNYTLTVNPYNLLLPFIRGSRHTLNMRMPYHL